MPEATCWHCGNRTYTWSVPRIQYEYNSTENSYTYSGQRTISLCERCLEHLDYEVCSDCLGYFPRSLMWGDKCHACRGSTCRTCGSDQNITTVLSHLEEIPVCGQHSRLSGYYICNRCNIQAAPLLSISDDEWELVCERCHTAIGGNTRIYHYSYLPELHYNRVTENNSNPLFLGVELEVNHPTCRPRDHANFLPHLPNWTFAKADSSITNGFEIVSHPMTYEWLQLHVGELIQMLEKLREMGYTSGTSGCCGMHIHMSKLAFTRLQLYKFLMMVYGYPNLTLYLSQRATADELYRWASMNSNDRYNKRRARDLNQGGMDRHHAVNVSYNRPTIELRIFSGTLNSRVFMKNIECAIALYTFAADVSLQDMGMNPFFDYVLKLKAHYPYLSKFITQTRSERAKMFSLDTEPVLEGSK